MNSLNSTQYSVDVSQSSASVHQATGHVMKSGSVPLQVLWEIVLDHYSTDLLWTVAVRTADKDAASRKLVAVVGEVLHRRRRKDED